MGVVEVGAAVDVGLVAVVAPTGSELVVGEESAAVWALVVPLPEPATGRPGSVTSM